MRFARPSRSVCDLKADKVVQGFHEKEHQLTLNFVNNASSPLDNGEFCVIS